MDWRENQVAYIKLIYPENWKVWNILLTKILSSVVYINLLIWLFIVCNIFLMP